MRIIVIQRSAVRIGQRDADRLVLRLQTQADASDRPARPRRAGEAIDPLVHLPPQLFGGTDDVRVAIGGVVELVRPDRARRLLGDAPRRVHEMTRVGKGGGGHEHEFGTQRAQRVHLLATLRLGHHDDRLVALGIGDQRQADPGIARGPLDNRPARLEQAACSASSTMNSAARSLIEAPGLVNSHLPKISHPVASLGPFSRTSGVFPIRASVSGAVSVSDLICIACRWRHSRSATSALKLSTGQAGAPSPVRPPLSRRVAPHRFDAGLNAIQRVGQFGAEQQFTPLVGQAERLGDERRYRRQALGDRNLARHATSSYNGSVKYSGRCVTSDDPGAFIPPPLPVECGGATLPGAIADATNRRIPGMTRPAARASRPLRLDAICCMREAPKI